MLGPRAETSSDPRALPAKPTGSEPQLLGFGVVRDVFVHGGGILIDPLGFAPRIVGDGGREARVGNIVRGAGNGGDKSARDLVLALGAGRGSLKVFFFVVFDALVVTGVYIEAVGGSVPTPHATRPE